MRLFPSVRLASLLLVLMLTISGFTARAAAAGKAVPKNVDASELAGNEGETAVAINQLHPNQLTIVTNLGSASGLFHAWSGDSGRTWNHDIIFPGACCDGQLASDEFGNIFLVYLSGNILVSMAISTDGGASFQSLPFVATDVGVPKIPFRSLAPSGKAVGGDQPSIAAAKGSVWVSWTGNNGIIQTSAASVTGLGQVGTFSPPQGLPGPHNVGDYGDIAIGPQGQVFVVYQNPTGGEGPATIYGALDPDGLGPQGFQPPQTLQMTNVGGFDYIPAQSGRSIDAEAGLVWDRTGGAHNGRLYLIYLSEEPQESNDTDVQLRFSDDNGATWSNSLRVNDDATTNSQFNPRISLDPTTGNVAIAWEDCRNDRGNHGPGDTNGVPNDDAMMYVTLSRNGGASFLPNKRLSAGASNDNDAANGVDYGDYGGFMFYGGNLYYASADNSNSTHTNPDGKLSHFDIYTQPVHVQ
ncbi:MAG TPA: sialidase family protein [Terriglobales bacterium]|nr:sialidase family protein [Terriglobales bacterium]